MAENMTAMRVEGTTVIGAQEKHRQSHPRRLGAYGLVAVILLALLIGDGALHDRQETGSVALATEHINKAESSQYAVATTGAVALATEHLNKAESSQYAAAPTGSVALATEHINKMENMTPSIGQDR